MVGFPRRWPPVVGWLIAAVLVTSLVAAIDAQAGGRLYTHLALVPSSVWRGELWRLVTWTLVERSPWALVFGCVSLYWFGGDLSRTWGGPRLLRFVVAIVLVTSVGTSLVALVFPDTRYYPHLGGWALGDALLIAWAFTFPLQPLRILPWFHLAGPQLAYFTFGLTVLFAIYYGLAPFLPEVIAGGAAIYAMTSFPRVRKNLVRRYRRRHLRVVPVVLAAVLAACGGKKEEPAKAAPAKAVPAQASLGVVLLVEGHEYFFGNESYRSATGCQYGQPSTGGPCRLVKLNRGVFDGVAASLAPIAAQAMRDAKAVVLVYDVTPAVRFEGEMAKLDAAALGAQSLQAGKVSRDLAAGLAAAADAVGRMGAAKSRVIVVSDGFSPDAAALDAAIARLKSAGAELVPIHVDAGTAALIVEDDATIAANRANLDKLGTVTSVKAGDELTQAITAAAVRR